MFIRKLLMLLAYRFHISCSLQYFWVIHTGCSVYELPINRVVNSHTMYNLSIRLCLQNLQKYDSTKILQLCVNSVVMQRQKYISLKTQIALFYRDKDSKARKSNIIHLIAISCHIEINFRRLHHFSSQQRAC